MRLVVASQEPGASRGLVPVVREAAEQGHEVHVLSRYWASTVFAPLRGPSIHCREITGDLAAETAAYLRDVGADAVLTGLAGRPGGSLDLQGQAEAKTQGIFRAGLLDASMYYLDRVAGPRGEPFYYLPDKIFVLNEFTRQEMIADGFPAQVVCATGQPAYDYLASPLPKSAPGSGRHVVFFSEGLAAEGQRRPEHDVGYDETTVIPLLIACLAAFPGPEPLRLTVKRHPKEQVPARTYQPVPRLLVTDVSDTDPVALMLAADVVCGMSSSLLLEGWLAGKLVVSLQPGLSSWNRLVLGRAGLIPTAFDEVQAKTLMLHALQATAPAAKPLEWCPMIGQAARAIVNELSRS
jgi:hypothetical protein